MLKKILVTSLMLGSAVAINTTASYASDTEDDKENNIVIKRSPLKSLNLSDKEIEIQNTPPKKDLITFGKLDFSKFPKKTTPKKMIITITNQDVLNTIQRAILGVEETKENALMTINDSIESLDLTVGTAEQQIKEKVIELVQKHAKDLQEKTNQHATKRKEAIDLLNKTEKEGIDSKTKEIEDTIKEGALKKENAIISELDELYNEGMKTSSVNQILVNGLKEQINKMYDPENQE